MTTDTLLSPVFGTAQIRQLERHALEVLGLPADALMQRAAAAALKAIRQHWPQARSLLIGCGPGHNGGDGWLLAELAVQQGLAVMVYSLTDADDYPRQREAVLAGGGWVQRYVAGQALPAADVLVDALFGIGLNRAPDATASALIEALNAADAPVLALDCPSGLNAETGTCPGAVVKATVTLSFLGNKSGLVTGQAAAWIGQLQLDDLGMSAAVAALTPVAQALPWPRLAPRSAAAHKGKFGHLLIVGGDHGTGGAVHLAAGAALRCGAGLVTVATRGEQVSALNGRHPEVMAHGVDGPPALQPLLARATGLAVGPGLGQNAWSHALWLAALESGKPLVLDADGLNLLASHAQTLPPGSVLTPHPGEAARLLQISTEQVEADRYAAARALAQRYQAVVVLKGAGSLVADPDGQLRYCRWGNPGMATGGMGDTLTGIIAALLVQGASAWQAACDGVSLHALAADRAARDGQRGLLPSDLLPELRRLVNGLGDA